MDVKRCCFLNMVTQNLMPAVVLRSLELSKTVRTRIKALEIKVQVND